MDRILFWLIPVVIASGSGIVFHLFSGKACREKAV